MDLQERIAEAVRFYWRTRDRQGEDQTKRGTVDQGNRGRVTGGQHMNGFIHLARQYLYENGCAPQEVYVGNSRMELPGYFRPTKKWDLLVIRNRSLVAALEFKALNGPSFGNNANNRTEEALGSAVDLATAHREGAFQVLPRPWLGYFILLEQEDKSTRPVQTRQPHFEVFPALVKASYQRRMELLCERLVLEKHYDGTCFMMSSHAAGIEGSYSEPVRQLSFGRFLRSLLSYIQGHF